MITIIVPDRIVGIDGAFKTLGDVDWTPFARIHAVQAWPDRDRAEVEFAAIDPDGDGPLPSVKPANALISAAEFEARFGGLLRAYAAAPVQPRQDPGESFDHSQAVNPYAEMNARMEALEASMAELERVTAKNWGALLEDIGRK